MARPPAHYIGDIGEAIVETAFLKAGWITNKLNRDYGFDFIVQYESFGLPKWAIAFLQVKSVASPIAPNPAGEFPFSVQVNHVGNWASAPVPAFLAICEIARERVFLVSCHEIALSLQKRYGDQWSDATERTIYLSPKSILNRRLFRECIKELKRWWKPLRPSRMESMAMLSNVSEPSWARMMAPWIFSYWERRDPLIKKLDTALGNDVSRYLRREALRLLEKLDSNMKWSDFA